LKTKLKPSSHSDLYHAIMRSRSFGQLSPNQITPLHLRARVNLHERLAQEGRGRQEGRAFFLLIYIFTYMHKNIKLFVAHQNLSNSCCRNVCLRSCGDICVLRRGLGVTARSSVGHAFAPGPRQAHTMRGSEPAFAVRTYTCCFWDSGMCSGAAPCAPSGLACQDRSNMFAGL